MTDNERIQLLMRANRHLHIALGIAMPSAYKIDRIRWKDAHLHIDEAYEYEDRLWPKPTAKTADTP